MAKKKTLPTFDVVGTLDELLPVEMLLVMSGYDNPDKDEQDWNNKICRKRSTDTSISVFGSSGVINYYTDVITFDPLPASDLNAIAKYIEDYGK